MTARWVSWSTRPPGGNMFRFGKAHFLTDPVEGRMLKCGRRVPRGALDSDPYTRQAGFARVSADSERETAALARCVVCAAKAPSDTTTEGPS